MESNKLTSILWDLLTKEDRERGYINVVFDFGISTSIKVGGSMVEKIKERSPFRDHITGFKRNEYDFDLVLDEEGQKLWDSRSHEMAEWISQFGND